VWLYQGIFFSSDYDMFSALKQNLGGHKFKDHGEVETALTL
jgi:hypothetical protein